MMSQPIEVTVWLEVDLRSPDGSEASYRLKPQVLEEGITLPSGDKLRVMQVTTESRGRPMDWGDDAPEA
jgi:hypothetical protein